MPFIPHTEEDIASMLSTIGASSIDDLFDEIPKHLRANELEGIPSGLSEMATSRLMNDIAAKDKQQLCFIGAGSYQHHIPAAVWELTGRGEFMTAYTPYQAEAAQGNLQLIYEFQTMVASLTGMDLANASLYDGATACAEAVLMAMRLQKNKKEKRVLIPMSLHPHYLDVIRTVTCGQNIIIEEIPYCTNEGRLACHVLENYADLEISAIIIPQPNFFGVLEDVEAYMRFAKAQQCLTIAVVNPTSLALLQSPGTWGECGVDIVCGEGQPLGIPLASGGPYFGFMATKLQHVRAMPGRLVGKTTDNEGTSGFTLTLQAREQHIRRSKATSNICTNQGLMVTAATIYMSLLGPLGLKKVAGLSHTNTKMLMNALTSIKGVERVFPSPFFHEAVIKLPLSASTVLSELNRLGIQGGFELSHHYQELQNCLLVCATEIKTADDINEYKLALESILANK